MKRKPQLASPSVAGGRGATYLITFLVWSSAFLLVANIFATHTFSSSETKTLYVPGSIPVKQGKRSNSLRVDSETKLDVATSTVAPSKKSSPLDNLREELREKALQNEEFVLKPNKEAGVHEVETGYLKLPTIPEGPRTVDDGKLHIVFSSGCNKFQHWQSELLLASAHAVGQRGRITRIVSGCHDKSAETVNHSHQTFPKGDNDLLVSIETLKKSVNPNFGLFVTPSFVGAKDFPWINKPSSIDYFMRYAREELDSEGETVIAILDPDFVFLQPLTQAPLPPADMIRTRFPGATGDNVVRKGRPVAQRYGLSGAWVQKFPVAKIIGDPNSHALTYSYRQAADLFSVGPPLMLHVDDLTDLAVLWTQYMRPVLAVEADILADMWAYCMAAAHLGLEHTILDQYMISTWGSDGQSFPWVDKWEAEGMSCLSPPSNPPAGSDLKLPTYLHLASNFKAPLSAEWMFHKGHVPGDILSCDMPLIAESPDDLYNISERTKHTKQKAFVLCHTVARLNDMLVKYKTKFCPAGFEQRKLVRLVQHKTRDRGCNSKKQKWCFPLAQIEGLPEDWRTNGPDAE